LTYQLIHLSTYQSGNNINHLQWKRGGEYFSVQCSPIPERKLLFGWFPGYVRLSFW